MQTVFTDPKIAQQARTARWSKGPRILSLLLAVWFGVVVAVLLLPHNYPGIRALVVYLLSILLGLVFAILFLIALWFGQARIASLAGLVMTISISVGIVFEGISWGAAGNFHLNRRHYEATVNRIKTAGAADRETACGEECFILSSDPLRVAFHYSHSYLNWTDIVYDPTGEISTSDWRRRKDLNMYLMGSTPLTGDWYLGHFGD